jgi:hypothetical protein
MRGNAPIVSSVISLHDMPKGALPGRLLTGAEEAYALTELAPQFGVVLRIRVHVNAEVVRGIEDLAKAVQSDVHIATAALGQPRRMGCRERIYTPLHDAVDELIRKRLPALGVA